MNKQNKHKNTIRKYTMYIYMLVHNEKIIIVCVHVETDHECDIC